MNTQQLRSEFFKKTHKNISKNQFVIQNKLTFKNINNIAQLNKNRITNGLPLKNLNKLESQSSSISNEKSLQNSLRNVINSSYFNTQRSMQSSVLTIKQKSSVIEHKNESVIFRSRSISTLSKNNSKVSNEDDQTEKQLLFHQKQKKKSYKYLSPEQQIQELFTAHFSRTFIQNLIQFMNKNWTQQQNSLMADQRIQILINVIIQKSNSVTQLINDFISTQYNSEVKVNNKHIEIYSQQQKKLLMSILFKQSQKTIQDILKIFKQLLSKLPQDGIIQQQCVIQQLQKSLLEIYDPKYTYSSAKMKERFSLYFESYISKRTSLQSQIKLKLKPTLDFLSQIQRYFSAYQRQLTKLKTTILSLEKQRDNLQMNIQKKTSFNPIQINYQRLRQLKQQSHNNIKKDLEENIIAFHNNKHLSDQQHIKRLQIQKKEILQQLENTKNQVQILKQTIQDYKNRQPKKKDCFTQIFNLPSSNSNIVQGEQQISTSLLPNCYSNFIQNVVTPFTFNQKITGGLITILSVDKVLYDFQSIKNKSKILSFSQFLFQWFIIRTGNKKVSQIFVKNFIYSIRKYRNKHKRFNIFNKICGFSPFRNKNMEEDIQQLFYQTHLAWYYVVKFALMYRKKLNDQPSGYHFFPPINCQQIFKISLRKCYQIILDFFKTEQIQVPQNLTQKVDHYCINEISKFKQNDQKFQKEQLQEIHILRQINFDVILGFILEHVAAQKAKTIQKLLRNVHLKQKESNNLLGYPEYQKIHKQNFKDKRAKIQLIYSKMCLSNQFDIMNVQNMNSFVISFIQDQQPLRAIFQKVQDLKSFVITQKQLIFKSDKKIMNNPNSFQHFRQRYYGQFYDFYDTTIFLEEVFKTIKNLIRKKLRMITKDIKKLNLMIQPPKYKIYGQQQQEKQQQKKHQHQKDIDSDEENEQIKDEENDQKQKTQNDQKGQPVKISSVQLTYFQVKLQEWQKIIPRVPHFAKHVLTIDQIVVHKMRRKQMIDASQFAWRVLRQILVFVSKQ